MAIPEKNTKFYIQCCHILADMASYELNGNPTVSAVAADQPVLGPFLVPVPDVPFGPLRPLARGQLVGAVERHLNRVDFYGGCVGVTDFFCFDGKDYV